MKLPVLAAFIGPDTSGKSTLIKELEKRAKRRAIYRGGPTKSVIEGLQKADACLSNLPQDGPYFLCEHINNIDAVVYAPIFGYTPTQEEEEAVEAFETKWSSKLVLIYCEVPIPLLRLRLKERGDPFVKEADIPRIVQRYEERLAKTKLNILKVESFNESPTLCALTLDQVLTKRLNIDVDWR